MADEENKVSLFVLDNQTPAHQICQTLFVELMDLYAKQEFWLATIKIEKLKRAFLNLSLELQHKNIIPREKNTGKRIMAEYKTLYSYPPEDRDPNVWNHILFDVDHDLAKGIIRNMHGVGVKRTTYIDGRSNCLEFNGQGYVEVLNCDEINLDKWEIHIEFSITNNKKSCFIFDKRNDLGHRNYCFGYITPDWFQYHLTNISLGYYFFVEVGKDVENGFGPVDGICIPIDCPQPDISYAMNMGYDGKELFVDFMKGRFRKERISLGEIKGDGPLHIGTVGAPFHLAYPDDGIWPFEGKIKSIKIYSLED